MTTIPSCSYHDSKRRFAFEKIRYLTCYGNLVGGWGRMNRVCIPKGFSLVELLVVIALMAVVAAIAVPQFQRSAANADLRTASRDVAANLSNTRQRAVEENLSVYRLTFNGVSNNYSLSRVDTGLTLWTKPFNDYGSGIRISSINSPVVSFQSRGTVAPAGTLVLQNRLNSTATVTFTINGRTHVQFNMQ